MSHCILFALCLCIVHGVLANETPFEKQLPRSRELPISSVTGAIPRLRTALSIAFVREAECVCLFRDRGEQSQGTSRRR